MWTNTLMISGVEFLKMFVSVCNVSVGFVESCLYDVDQYYQQFCTFLNSWTNLKTFILSYKRHEEVKPEYFRSILGWWLTCLSYKNRLFLQNSNTEKLSITQIYADKVMPGLSGQYFSSWISVYKDAQVSVSDIFKHSLA